MAYPLPRTSTNLEREMEHSQPRHYETSHANHFDSPTRQGTQGQHDTASKSVLENEFGTSVDEDVIKIILEKGTVQEAEVSSVFIPTVLPASNISGVHG